CAVCGCCQLEVLPENSSDDLPSVSQVLGDPAASSWLTHALATALIRDPVDAANDAEALARLLDGRCREILQRDLTVTRSSNREDQKVNALVALLAKKAEVTY